jgi:hypothetical protein
VLLTTYKHHIVCCGSSHYRSLVTTVYRPNVMMLRDYDALCDSESSQRCSAPSVVRELLMSLLAG